MTPTAIARIARELARSIDFTAGPVEAREQFEKLLPSLLSQDAEPVQEPVAWRWKREDGGWAFTYSISMKAMHEARGVNLEPLYSHPLQPTAQGDEAGMSQVPYAYVHLKTGTLAVRRGMSAKDYEAVNADKEWSALWLDHPPSPLPVNAEAAARDYHGMEYPLEQLPEIWFALANELKGNAKEVEADYPEQAKLFRHRAISIIACADQLKWSLSHASPLGEEQAAKEGRPQLHPDTAAREVEAWKETAEQAFRNADFYRGLIVEIGEMFGEEAYTSDDGSVQQDVLALKVPELVAASLKRHQLTEGE